ncbi:MAG: ATP-binding protein [Candidatus Riflebacteria bacterium]|nr:ATP-binding protein [Candidatus Riflebacteria bacterium]
MKFLGRMEELGRLRRLTESKGGGLAVVHGRRRVGKTRLLLEWLDRVGGLYFVADTSAPPLQRRYLAETLARKFPGFADVSYPDWRSLFARLAGDAERDGWRGPLVLDEIPCLAAASPELPSVLQGWLDGAARKAGLIIAIAGSSQRMMQGIVLGRESPLYQRAREILKLDPLPAECLRAAFGVDDPTALVDLYTAWGGIPKYWELSRDLGMVPRDQVEHLVLDPLGALHDEPNTLIIEEDPAIAQIRPLLDVIGAGAHRASEIAGRIGRPATALSEPLRRLQEVGLVIREVPFGKSAKTSKQSLYKLLDPFCRLWFRLVAPHRAALVAGTRRSRLHLLGQGWPGLASAAWEELTRLAVPRLSPDAPIGRTGPWGPALRWWAGRGKDPQREFACEWDFVAESLDGARLLLGETKWSAEALSAEAVEGEARRLLARPRPQLPGAEEDRELVFALAVIAVNGRPDLPPGVVLLTGSNIFDPTH